MRILCAALLSLSFSFAAAAASQPPPKYGIENVWPGTWVYPPGHKGAPFLVSNEARWQKAVAAITSPVPTVIYVHGCDGFDWTFYEADYAKALSRAGFMVFAPDSYARGSRRRNVCGNTRIDTIELRREEVRETLRQIESLPWVDKNNLFLAGHSEGGITTAMFKGSQFRAYYIAGWTCTSKSPEFDRIHAPADRPVLAVVGTNDEYHVGTFREKDDCGMRMKNRPGSKSIVLKGWDHDVSKHSATVPALIEFFKANIVK